MMATQQTQRLAKLLIAPSIMLLLAWMIVPLAMTAWYSLLDYNLLNPGRAFVGLANYAYFLGNPGFLSSLGNTLLLVGAVLAITSGLGVLAALLLDEVFIGRSLVRLMLIAPFFIMPTVSALIWKNLLMHPVSGVLAWLWQLFGLTPVDWFTQYPMLSIILIVAWQWLPFSVLILLTALQSMDQEQQEAAFMDGAGALNRFWYLTLPHLARPLTIVILIEAIYLLTVFAEIYVTTNGGPGMQSTTLAYLIYQQALLQYDVGTASAGGLVAVVLANIAAFLLIHVVGKNLET
jgi:sorbitol/mannitol transport system permease protein